jgi:RNA polymerase sigma-70 factor (ECF subfamily)
MNDRTVERDTPLIRAAREGDTAAYAELVRSYERIACRAASFLAGANDGEEVAQLAFVKAYYALKRFQLGRPFQPWLLQIVMNEAKSARRAAGRRAAIVTRAIAHAGSAINHHQPAEDAARNESHAQLGAALARLSDKHRAVVTCRYLLDLSEEETAAVLGLRAGTVKSRLSRALERLRVELENAEAGEGGRPLPHVARQSASQAGEQRIAPTAPV